MHCFQYSMRRYYYEHSYFEQLSWCDSAIQWERTSLDDISKKSDNFTVFLGQHQDSRMGDLRFNFYISTTSQLGDDENSQIFHITHQGDRLVLNHQNPQRNYTILDKIYEHVTYSASAFSEDFCDGKCQFVLYVNGHPFFLIKLLVINSPENHQDVLGGQVGWQLWRYADSQDACPIVSNIFLLNQSLQDQNTLWP